MNNRNKLKIDSLIERLSIDYRCNQVMSAEQFKELEERLSLEIPQDYQYFCQVFGSGRLDNFIDVYCLVDNLIMDIIGMMKVETQKSRNVGWAMPTSKLIRSNKFDSLFWLIISKSTSIVIGN